jgi:REP element-mobilizing transposase RayT
MGRRVKIDYPGAINHVIQRGNNRQYIFNHPHEKQRLLELLHQVVTRYDTYLLFYVIMDNHYHMIFQSGTTPIAQVMRSLNVQYARYYNYIYERTGHVFETRFRSTQIKTSWQLLRALRYIAYNPVRSGLADCPAGYQWSAHQEICQGNTAFIASDHLMQLIGPVDQDKPETKAPISSSAFSRYLDCIENPAWADSSRIPMVVHRYFTSEERLAMMDAHLERLGLDICQRREDRDLFLLYAVKEGISRRQFLSYVKKKIEEQKRIIRAVYS